MTATRGKTRSLKSIALLIVANSLFLGTPTMSQPDRPSVKAGPDGVGGIPFAGPMPLGPSTIPYLTTLGLVVDTAYAALPGLPVVVMSGDGTQIAAGETNESGLFVLQLPDIAGLTVSLPMNGVIELPIEAGVPVLIVVE